MGFLGCAREWLEQARGCYPAGIDPDIKRDLELLEISNDMKARTLRLPTRLFQGPTSLSPRDLGAFILLVAVWTPNSTSPVDVLARYTGIGEKTLSLYTKRIKNHLEQAGLMVRMQCDERTRSWLCRYPAHPATGSLWKKALQQRTGLERILWRKFGTRANKAFWPHAVLETRLHPYWGQGDRASVILALADIKDYLDNCKIQDITELKRRELVIGWLAFLIFKLQRGRPVTHRELRRDMGVPLRVLTDLEESGWRLRRPSPRGVQGFVQIRGARPTGPFGFLADCGICGWDQLNRVSEKLKSREFYDEDEAGSAGYTLV